MEKRLIDYKDLTTREKIDHIWEYYKFPILGSLFALLCIYWILNHYIFNPPAETTMDISIFGTFAQTEVTDELELALNHIIVHEGENETTLVEFFSTSPDLDVTTQQAVVTKMMGKATLREFDIMIFEGDFYQNYLQEDVLMPLNDLIDQGFINVDSEKFIKGIDVNYISDDIFIIDISDHEGFQRVLNTDEAIYLGIYIGTQHIEHVKEVLDYLLNEFK